MTHLYLRSATVGCLEQEKHNPKWWWIKNKKSPKENKSKIHLGSAGSTVFKKKLFQPWFWQLNLHQILRSSLIFSPWPFVGRSYIGKTYCFTAQVGSETKNLRWGESLQIATWSRPGQEVMGSKVRICGSYPKEYPISRWNKPLILTIDPNFLEHPSRYPPFGSNSPPKSFPSSYTLHQEHPFPQELKS